MTRDVAEALREDPALAPYVETHGSLELDPADDTFERLFVSLIRQQVSMNAASAIRDRVYDAVDVSPGGILAADDDHLREAGLSASKVRYANNLAQAYLDNGYDRSYFADMDDDAVSEELTSITGIGPWTAKMFLMFALGRPDVFPVEDLGVRKGMEIACDQEMTRAAMCDRAADWAPYRSYASLYLWRAYEG